MTSQMTSPLISHITQPYDRLVEHCYFGVAAHVAAGHGDGFC